MSLRCVICGTSELRKAELTPQQESVKQKVPDELPYLTCNKCGLWAQLPPPPFQYEADDEKNQRRENVIAEATNIDWLASSLVQQYSPTSVLDIGSSYPLFARKLMDKGVPSVLAVDGCERALEYGKELDVPVVQGDFMKHDFGDRKFDMICMVHVIEHFHDPMLAVLRLKRLLKPNGLVFIRTPLNDTDGLTRWHLTKYHFQVHPIIFSQRSLKMLFELAGLPLVSESVGNGIGHGDYVFRVL